MTRPNIETRTLHSARLRRGLSLLALVLPVGLVAGSCSDDDDDDPMGGAGMGGSGMTSAGMGGMAGSGMAGSGMAGSGMAGGMMAAGSGGMGMGGAGMGTGPTGTLDTLSDDAAALLGPTTAALRGMDIYFANGQLSQLFGGGMPSLPFGAPSVPLAGGALGAAIELPGDTFYPEGIASAADGTLFIGSVTDGGIVRVPPDSTTAEAFVAGTDPERGVIGMDVDEDRELLWYCDSDPTAMPRAGAVVAVGLDDGEEVVRHDLVVPGVDSLFCNDILVDGAGNVWATESLAGAVFRIPAADVMTADSAAIWMQGGAAAPPPDGFGANGLDLVGGMLIVANVNLGTLFAVDPASTDPENDAQLITVTEAGSTTPLTLCGPDGVLAVPGSDTDLIVVENGGCDAGAPRVSVVTLSL